MKKKNLSLLDGYYLNISGQKTNINLMIIKQYKKLTFYMKFIIICATRQSIPLILRSQSDR